MLLEELLRSCPPVSVRPPTVVVAAAVPTQLPKTSALFWISFLLRQKSELPIEGLSGLGLLGDLTAARLLWYSWRLLRLPASSLSCCCCCCCCCCCRL